MSTSGRAFAATGDPIRGEPAILNFTNNNLPPELLRQQAAYWIVNELLPEIRGLTPEEQRKFVDRVDQVCWGESFLNAPLYHFYKDISNCRLQKRENHNRLRESVQRNRATSDLDRTLPRTQKPLQSYRSARKILGYLERTIPRR